HREGWFTNKYTGAGLDERIEENAQSIVAAIRQKQFVGMHAEVTCQFACGRGIFGISGNLFGGEAGQSLSRRDAAAGGVFVEVQANFIGAAFGGRFISAAKENRFAHGELHVHRRTSTALACAKSPSALANTSTSLARRRKPRGSIVCTLMHFTKSLALRPPRRRAQPPVGKTWLLPLA